MGLQSKFPQVGSQLIEARVCFVICQNGSDTLDPFLLSEIRYFVCTLRFSC